MLLRPIRYLAVAAFAVTLGYPGWLAFQIWEQSHSDELPFRAADAIVVLGAAQYNGQPSPVFQARLDHAHYLFDEGYSRRVIVTGGKRRGDRFTEAQAGERYLTSEGLSADAILGVRGRTTLQSLRELDEVAQKRRIDSLMLVSDPLHSERIKRIAHDLGFDPVYSSPASYTHVRRSRGTKLREIFREVGSLLVYELLDR